MFEHFWCVEVAVSRKPSGRNVGSVCKQAKVGDKPHPVTLDNDRQNSWSQNADYQARPKSHQRKWIWFKDAVRKVPWQQVRRFQRSTATGPTDDVPYLVSERHDDPRRDDQEKKPSHADCQQSGLHHPRVD